MIIITAEWKAVKGKELELQNYLEKMVDQVRAKEPGCLEYTLHRGKEQGDVFFFYEKYESSEAIEQHKHTTHFSELMEVTANLIQEPVMVKDLVPIRSK